MRSANTQHSSVPVAFGALVLISLLGCSRQVADSQTKAVNPPKSQLEYKNGLPIVHNDEEVSQFVDQRVILEGIAVTSEKVGLTIEFNEGRVTTKNSDGQWPTELEGKRVAVTGIIRDAKPGYLFEKESAEILTDDHNQK